MAERYVVQTCEGFASPGRGTSKGPGIEAAVLDSQAAYRRIAFWRSEDELGIHRAAARARALAKASAYAAELNRLDAA